MIKIHNVCFQRNNKEILKDINWEVKRGEHWSILGLNGSGKTTLLNIVNGYLFPSSGRVEVLGNLFGKTYIPDVRKKIGLVSASLQQQIEDFESVLGVVLSGKFASIGLWEAVEKSDVDLAERYLKLLNCEHLKEEQYGVLSQGERQRVLISRALMSQPDILILDEPCNGLDIIAREELLEFIETLSKETDCPTLIYVTHYVEEILPCFTHTLLLKEGQVFSQGRSKEVLTQAELSSFFGRPVSIRNEQERLWIALKNKVQQS